MILGFLKSLLKSPLAVSLVSTVTVGAVYFGLQFQATLQTDMAAAKEHLNEENTKLVQNSFYKVNKDEIEKILGGLKSHSVTYYEMSTPKEKDFFKSSGSNLICDNEQTKRLSLPGGLNAGSVNYCISNLKIAKKSFKTWPIILCLFIIIVILGVSTFTPYVFFKKYLQIILDYFEHFRDAPEVRAKFLKTKDTTINNMILLLTQKITKEIEANKLISQMEAENRISKVVSKAGHDLENTVSDLKKKVRLCMSDLPKESKDMIYSSLNKIDIICADIRSENKEKSKILAQAHYFEAEPHIKRSISELKAIFPRVLFHVDVEEGLKVRALEIDFERVISNLVRNSCEVIWKKKKAKVKVEAKLQDDGMALITVTDNGPGIPEEVQEMIFDESFTYGKENGTGLGLSYVKQRIRDWDGLINFKTGPSGTSFRIQLKSKKGFNLEKSENEYEKENTPSNVISI